jgi:phosphoenolpyruvate carboxylase
MAHTVAWSIAGSLLFLGMTLCCTFQGDPRVAQFYEKELVDKDLWPLGDDLRNRFENTKNLLLKVQNHADLLGGPESQLLKQKLALRGPYVTPLNVLQVQFRQRLGYKPQMGVHEVKRFCR